MRCHMGEPCSPHPSSLLLLFLFEAGKTEKRLANISREGRPLPEVEIDLRWIEGARG